MISSDSLFFLGIATGKVKTTPRAHGPTIRARQVKKLAPMQNSPVPETPVA